MVSTYFRCELEFVNTRFLNLIGRWVPNYRSNKDELGHKIPLKLNKDTKIEVRRYFLPYQNQIMTVLWYRGVKFIKKTIVHLVGRYNGIYFSQLNLKPSDCVICGLVFIVLRLYNTRDITRRKRYPRRLGAAANYENAHTSVKVPLERRGSRHECKFLRLLGRRELCSRRTALLFTTWTVKELLC